MRRRCLVSLIAMTLLEGDLRAPIDLGQKEYDLIILGHIIHSEGEKSGKRLPQKSYRALKPGADTGNPGDDSQ